MLLRVAVSMQLTVTWTHGRGQILCCLIAAQIKLCGCAPGCMYIFALLLACAFSIVAAAHCCLTEEHGFLSAAEHHDTHCIPR